MKRKFLLLLNTDSAPGGATTTTSPDAGGATVTTSPAATPGASQTPASPTAAAVVMAGTRTEEMIRVEGELQAIRQELADTKTKLTSTEAERKDRETTICELQDRLEATKKEKRALEDAIGKKAKRSAWAPLIGSED